MSAQPEQSMSYRRALLAFGNGDLGRGQQNLFMLARRLEEARKKHRHFADDRFHALRVVSCEFHELCYAVTHESPDRQLDEALDVACTCMRFVNREYRMKGGKHD
ncbi:MAG: hypothetical protein HDR50_06750 [Desulfovibrio sp.]|uniref:hypothetical protein n=1 Tax=Desulfovibrio sp. TaxID=885 RepID=UPI001A6647EB|nr:hypothetical protein [Desulfovibrio sp.]MBD5417347.1 hypothetical protein [Desulfovibrio sp.]